MRNSKMRLWTGALRNRTFLMRHPRETLAALDEFEGVDEGLFRRDLVKVRINDKPLKAWAYFYARSVERSNLLPVGVYSSE
jgi:gamma-glutamylcyclotransferase (GGCT)/AIG2-like uncharacterized protein YtfP